MNMYCIPRSNVVSFAHMITPFLWRLVTSFGSIQ